MSKSNTKKTDPRSKIVELMSEFPEAECISRNDNPHMSLEVRKKRFGYYLDDHHGDGRISINCKTTDDLRTMLEAVVPDQLHVPKYLGSKGWIGLWIDLPKTNWGPVRDALLQAYKLTAPKKLLAEFERGRV